MVSIPRRLVRETVAGVLVAALVAPSGAFGQEGPPLSDAPAPKPGLELQLETGEQLPDPEKITRSRDHLGAMRQALSTVLAKLEEARDSKDVIKLNCVNEKLTQVKGLLKISENAGIALEEAVARRESDVAQHEYQRISIARQKVDQLRTESEECIGEIVIGLDEEGTIVEVEEPEDLTEVDPTKPEPAPIPVMRAPAASPVD